VLERCIYAENDAKFQLIPNNPAFQILKIAAHCTRHVHPQHSTVLKIIRRDFTSIFSIDSVASTLSTNVSTWYTALFLNFEFSL